MKLPLNASQTIAVVAVTGALLAGAYAVGRSQGADAPPSPATPTAPNEEMKTLAATPSPSKAPSARSEARLCSECARVVAVRSEERQGQASGLGAIGGAVVGGLLGNQVGGGNGRKLATVGGAVAGGYAGNEIEKRSKSERVWVVTLANQDGSTHKHRQAEDPQLRAGDVVTLRDGQLQRR